MDRIIVVGGGPAGLMAAATAACEGLPVLLVEGTSRLGNKLRLTGGGHGNVTHEGSVADHLAHIPRHPEFARPALEALHPQALRDLLRQWGLPTASDEQGRVFPLARNAHQIATALRSRCLAQRVTLRLSSPVERIIVRDGAGAGGTGAVGTAAGIAVAGREIGAAAVVLATGGASYPETGSDGSGLGLAAALGHAIVALQPGLVAFQAAPGAVEGLQGLSLREVVVSLAQHRRTVGRACGDLLFTPQGLSGPAAHNLSLLAAGPVEEGQLTLHWLASQGLTLDRVRQMAAQAPNRAWHTLLLPNMPPRLEHYVAVRLNVTLGVPWRSLGQAEQARLLQAAEALPFAVVGTAPLDRAMVTLGGVDVAAVDPLTMGSRLIAGLFFAGELLDVTGESGGYNLQLAFATGYLAGQSAARFAGAQRAAHVGEPRQ